MYAFAREHTHIRARTHTHTQTYALEHLRANTKHTHTHTHTHTHRSARTHTQTRVYVHVHVRARARAHTHERATQQEQHTDHNVSSERGRVIIMHTSFPSGFLSSLSLFFFFFKKRHYKHTLNTRSPDDSKTFYKICKSFQITDYSTFPSSRLDVDCAILVHNIFVIYIAKLLSCDFGPR